jgi:hypothetical protein
MTIYSEALDGVLHAQAVVMDTLPEMDRAAEIQATAYKRYTEAINQYNQAKAVLMRLLNVEYRV